MEVFDKGKFCEHLKGIVEVMTRIKHDFVEKSSSLKITLFKNFTLLILKKTPNRLPPTIIPF